MKSEPDRAAAQRAARDMLERTFAERVVPAGRAVPAGWARLPGGKDKNQRDKALAATAWVHAYGLVIRNIPDFRGCNVDGPGLFRRKPAIMRV